MLAEVIAVRCQKLLVQDLLSFIVHLLLGQEIVFLIGGLQDDQSFRLCHFVDCFVIALEMAKQFVVVLLLETLATERAFF